MKSQWTLATIAKTFTWPLNLSMSGYAQLEANRQEIIDTILGVDGEDGIHDLLSSGGKDLTFYRFDFIIKSMKEIIHE